MQTQTITQWERVVKQPQPRFHDKLVVLLEVADKVQLRGLFSQAVKSDGPVAETAGATEHSKPDRLTLVRDVGAQVQNLMPPSDIGWARLDENDLLEAAMAIITAKKGRLSDTDGEIVKTQLAYYNERRQQERERRTVHWPGTAYGCATGRLDLPASAQSLPGPA